MPDKDTTLMSPLFGEGEDWEYGTTVDEDFTKELEKQDPEVRFSEAVNAVAESRIFPDNLLIINDVFLYGIPTAAIRVEKPTDVFVGETLRTASPILYSEGRQNPALYLTLLFKYNIEQLQQLHRIVSVLRRHPFTYIHHNKIAREIGTKEFESTIFALESGTLRSASDTVDVIILDLSFKLFNYKPFTNHHWYSGYLFSENTPKPSTNESDVEQNPLDMKGYSADQFSISTTTEEQRSSAAKRTLNNSILGDAPVVLPSESPAWMMYADRLSSPDLTPPVISDVPSDYIGFSVKEFEYISPPGSARAGKGDIGFWYNTDNSDLQPHVYPWRKTDGPIPTVQEEYAEAAVTFEDTPIAIDANSLATYRVIGRKKSTQIDSNTALWLGRMVVGEGGGKASDQKVSALIWAILNRWAFYYKNKSLIEAIRVFSQPVNPRWLPGGDLYAKWKGTKYTSEKRIARRQRITTLSWNSIPKRIRSLINRFRQGTLGSPEVFKSIRKSRITNWGSVKDLVWTKRLQTIGDQYIDISGDRFFQDAGIRGGSIEIITPKNPQGELAVPNDLDLNAAQKKVQEKQAALNNVKDNSSDKRRATDNLVKATTQAREAWINYQANANNKYYYNEDPNLRNIFYTSRETHISGDFRQQLNLKVAPNITCSAISISFGHRLAQIKLVGQSTSTFQFLGAGNRTGQLVFTYSGDDGEAAAKELKDIIDIARKNAQYFSQQIPEAGSVKIASYNPYSSEQNIILALLGIEDIVITNIEDSTSPNSPDTSQLVVEFIVQEFGRESYERKFVDSVDIRKSIIKGILEYVIYAKDPQSDFRKFIPHFSIATYNPGAGREYQVKPGIPSWFAGLVAKASEICTNTNDESPPTNWRRGTSSSETWCSAYDEYGAGDLIAGRTKNTSTFGYGVTYAQNLATATLNTVFGNGENLTANEVGENPTMDELIEANPLLQNGGQQTNDIHVDVFRKWLAQMTALATEAQQYVRDEENFKYYFGSVGTDILNTVTANLNACYDDMDLPNIPGTELRLPPEFYVYDDSGEDPMLSEATNRENMELFLKKHVDNEIASITHYMENAWLGGSYVSKNLPRILETRQAREQNVNAELLYFSTWFNLIVDGGQPWEPIKHRYADPSIEPSASINSWFGFMQNQMGAKTEDEMRLKYMDNLIRLSSYLKDGRHWGGSYESENRSTQSIVESIYGDAWNKVAFGPNPMYANADSAIAGLAEPESTLNARRIIEEQQAAESLKGNPNATKEISDLRTIRGDGAVTVGNLKEEEESEPLAGTIFEGLKEFVGVLSPVAVGIAGAVEYGINAADRVFSTFQNIIAMKHPLINKIKQDESSKNIAKLATSVALGNKKNDLSMRRAYPTFRVYFIEDDSEDTELYGKTIVRAFDDFYSYSAIQEIRIYRSRKIASDTAIIRMTNVTGKLMRRKFGDRDQTLQELERGERQGIFADTKEEHPFEKMVLQDGVKVQIRLGNCADEETEILTQRGWLKYNQLCLSDTILTLNNNTGESEWGSIDKINIFKVEDEPMVKFSSKKHSSLTTHDHRWPILYRKQTKTNNKYVRRFTTSKDFIPNSNRIIIGGAKCSSLIKEKHFSDDFVELIAWFWTEGNIINKGKNRNPCIVISQSHSVNIKNIKRIRNCLYNMFGDSVEILSTGSPWGHITEPKWTERKRNNRTETTFRLNSIASKEFIKWAPDKIVSTEFILKLTQEQLDLFINISNKADGNNSRSNKKPIIICQKTPQSLNALELAAILAGYKTHRFNKCEEVLSREGQIYCPSCLSISNKTSIFGDSITKEIVPYTGITWCPTTKNETWCARRNGHVFFTGNSPNPDDLETAFLGQIVEIAPAENGKILEIMMQGFGAELEAVELGPFEDGPVFFSTQQVLSGAIIQDSIINFGRKSKFNRFNPAEMRHAWTGGSGSNAIASISPARLLESWSNSGMEQALSQNTFLNYPQDDNIFAPSPEIYATAWERFWNNACSYRPLNQTAWQIFKEHELRHPGYCALAVPYGHSPRMTMFFGAKSQHYWSRPPTPFELYMSENNYSAMIRLRYMGINNSKDMLAVGQKFKELEAASPALAQALLADLISTSAPNNVLTELGKQFGRYVPFRNYHYFDDKHHIIKNEIKTSVDGTFNEVTVLYFENENSLDDDNEELTKNIQSMVTEDDGVFSVKLDENIPDQYLRSYKEAFPSCVTTEMARRYASGLLARHLKDAYKGELVVLGKGNIKPYDICFINDSSIDMTGPIEVEAVVQIISRDTGFVSVITPDLCVDVNDMYSASVFDVAAAGSAMVWGGTGLGGSLTGLGTLGLMAGVKIASWTQDGDPIVATPLTFGGRPFVSATLGANDTSMITQLYGKWRQYWDDLDDAWEKLDITEALFDTKIGIQESIFNTIGTGFSGGVRPAGE